MLHSFRIELFERIGATDDDLREAHMHVFSNIDPGGTRLTEMAARANIAVSFMAELVDELEHLGYVERLPDPTDGRAKLVCLTRQGHRHVQQALTYIAAMEEGYARRVGRERYEAMCQTLHELVTSLLADERDPDRVR